MYRALPDLDKSKAELARAGRLQQEIWSRSIASATGSQPATMAAEMHPPKIILGLLFGLSLLSALLAGYTMASARARDWLRMAAYAFTLSGTVYVILDIEYPRVGLIRVDAFDRVLVELRESMR